MFGLGTWEIAMILVVALIFIGPQKLPGLARSLGKGMRDLRRAMAGFEDEVRAATTLPPEEPAAPRSGHTSVSAAASGPASPAPAAEPTASSPPVAATPPDVKTANAEPAEAAAAPAPEISGEPDGGEPDGGEPTQERADAVHLEPPPPGQLASSEPPEHTAEPVSEARRESQSEVPHPSEEQTPA